MRNLAVAVALALAAVSPAPAQSDMSVVKGVSPEVRTSKVPGPEAFGFEAPQGLFQPGLRAQAIDASGSTSRPVKRAPAR
jgi:hypothetical protein